MKQKSNSIAKNIILFSIIFAVQVISFIYWQNQKNGFHTDEYCTMWYVNTANSSTYDGRPYFQIENWAWDEWRDISEFKDITTAEEDESVFLDSPGVNISRLINGSVRFYFWLLNVLCITLGIANIVKVAFALNLLLFIVTQLLLFYMIYRMTGNRIAAFATIAMYGFSSVTVSHMAFIRFYNLLLLFLLIILILFLNIWSSKKIWVIISSVLTSIPLLYLSVKMSELIIVVGGVLVVSMIIGLAIRKEFVRLALFGIPYMLGGLYYMIIASSWMDVIIHPTAYLSDNGQISNYLNSFYSITVKDVAYNVGLLGFYYSGRAMAIPTVIGVIAIMIVLFRKRRNALKASNAIYKFNENDTFCIILLSVLILYAVFLCFTNMTRQVRYDTLHFLVFMIITGVILGRLIDIEKDGKKIVYILSGLILVGALCIFIRGDIDYIYPQYRETGEKIRDVYADWDVMLVQAYDKHGPQCVYDCIYFSGDNVRMYAKSDLESRIDVNNCPDRFLVWVNYHEDLQGCEDLMPYYSFSYIGDFFDSLVYECKKK